MRRLIIEVFREGYDTEQVRNTMTINEMIEYLTEMAREAGGDTPVFNSHDNGYTYGGFREESFTIEEGEES